VSSSWRAVARSTFSDGRDATVERILNLIFASESPRHRTQEQADEQSGGPCPGAGTADGELARELPTLIRVYGIVLTLLLLLTVVTIGNPAFISQQNVFNMASQWAPAGIMAVGMTFVILTGALICRLRPPTRFCAVVAAYVGQTHAPSVAFAAAIAVGLLFGLANGILVAVVRINPFITTVGSGFIINGVALVMTQNAAFLVNNDDSESGGRTMARRALFGMLLVMFLVVFGLFWPVPSTAKPSMRSAEITKQAVCPEYESGPSSRAPMC